MNHLSDFPPIKVLLPHFFLSRHSPGSHADHLGLFASATILMRAAIHDWRGYAIALLTAAIFPRKSWNPLWLLAAGTLARLSGS